MPTTPSSDDKSPASDPANSRIPFAGAGSLGRRDFIRLAGLSSIALLASRPRIMAGPFEREDFAKLIPLDKKLRADWVASLTSRGVPEEYSTAAELQHIGMPVGGLFCGTVYLGGDGRLWLWDIFNRTSEGIVPEGGTLNGKKVKPRDGGAYVSPARADDHRVLEQGFRITTETASGHVTRTLDSHERTGFKKVAFTGEYPIGVVNYSDPGMPVSVTLEAFSPFIPLNAEDSSLPATIFSFSVRNEQKEMVVVTLEGLLENAVLREHSHWDGTRRIDYSDESGMTAMRCSARLAKTQPNHSAAAGEKDFSKLPDAGTLCLAVLGKKTEVRGENTEGPLNRPLVGNLGRRFSLAAGKSAEIHFVIAWHFPHVRNILGGQERHYAARFENATAVAQFVCDQFARLAGETRRWRDTWYDSTLPHWFLNRTFANTSILATTTANRFKDGRFWGWEGVGCCPGTCTHVWHYAHAMARIFPEVERDHRERVDFGIALDPKGVVHFRAENGATYAVDGQAGRILGVYREHQMSTNDAFLRRLWPKVKKALERLIETDGDADGIIRGPLHNTLDADWYGVVPWLCGLYHAGLRAGEQMALEVGDTEFASTCRGILNVASKSLDDTCWKDDYQYYVHRGDAEHAGEVGVYEGCHIDQVMGQSWAWQVGLGSVMTEERVKGALRSIWNYNFTPDVGPFRAVKTAGRWYAQAGEGGTIMVSYPFAPESKVTGKGAWSTMYFNECMSGFEHQVASHMLWEGMLTEGLAATRVVHDRYSPKLRNPYNEIECSDHYARAMASYGSFLAVCGFECHGPKGHLGFAPRITPGDFKAPFTSPEGWGTFSQKLEGGALKASVSMKWGKLMLKTFSLALPPGLSEPKSATAIVARTATPVKLAAEGNRIMLTFESELDIHFGSELTVEIS